MALTHALVAHAAAVAVFGAARARLDPGHERGEDRGEERGVASKARHYAQGETTTALGAYEERRGRPKMVSEEGGNARGRDWIA